MERSYALDMRALRSSSSSNEWRGLEMNQPLRRTLEELERDLADRFERIKDTQVQRAQGQYDALEMIRDRIRRLTEIGAI